MVRPGLLLARGLKGAGIVRLPRRDRPFEAMAVSDLVVFLRERVSLCRGFSDERLAELADGGEVVSVKPAEAVVRCGDDATFLGILLEGELVALAPEDGLRLRPSQSSS